MATSEQTAQALYSTCQRNLAACAAIDVAPTSAMIASYDAILAHVQTCDALASQYRCTMDAGKLWGQSPEQLRATALHKCRVLAGKRGKKMLIARYGERIAAEIIGK